MRLGFVFGETFRGSGKRLLLRRPDVKKNVPEKNKKTLRKRKNVTKIKKKRL